MSTFRIPPVNYFTSAKASCTADVFYMKSMGPWSGRVWPVQPTSVAELEERFRLEDAYLLNGLDLLCKTEQLCWQWCYLSGICIRAPLRVSLLQMGLQEVKVWSADHMQNDQVVNWALWWVTKKRRIYISCSAGKWTSYISLLLWTRNKSVTNKNHKN